MAKDHMTPQQKRELGTHLTALVGISRTHPGQVTDKVEAIKTYVNTMVNAAYQQGKEDMRDEMEEQLPL